MIKRNVTSHWPFALLPVLWLLAACSVTKRTADPLHPFTPAALQEDFTVFRGLLEGYHPGLYWFTPKDSMDRYFEKGYAALTHPLDEPAFLNQLTYITSRIRCGHTSLRRSRVYTRYLDTATSRFFPFHVNVWPDSVAVTSALGANTPSLGAGTVCTAINGRSIRSLTDTFLQHLTSDGYALSGKYQVLSNNGGFANVYRRIFGDTDSFAITYRDTTGNLQTKNFPAYVRMHKAPAKKQASPAGRRGSPLHPLHDLTIDSIHHSGIMTLNTFMWGVGLRAFFRKSFRTLQRQGISRLVVDVRSNGGGDARLAILLAQYLTDSSFKIADSLYAIRLSGPYNRYINHHVLYRTGMRLVTKSNPDGMRHFTYFERHAFPPKKRNHFKGDLYVITGGNSFSATTLFVKMVQGKKQVTVVGEETGGGSYGNSAWMLPQATLPHTGIRLTLPLFRMVMDQQAVQGGRGIIPDVWSGATVESIRLNQDLKMQKVFSLMDRQQKRAGAESPY